MVGWLGGSLECPVVDMSIDENEPPHQQRCPGNDNVNPPPDDPSLLLIMLSSRQSLIVIYVAQAIAGGPCVMGYGVTRVNNGFILNVKV